VVLSSPDWALWRGILVGVNASSLEVQQVVAGDRCVKFYVKSKVDHFRWALVAVYGAAQDEHKPEFLAELVRICENEALPILVGGTLILFVEKKRKIMTTLMRGGPFCSMPSLKV
jgi:hypothetical protein